MKKKIIVACGGAVATSTVAADAIRELCKKNNIDADVEQMRIIEIASNLDGVDLVVTTMRIKPDFSTPYVNGMAFLTGINQEATEKKILDVLTKK
ncbi:PTS galactitol transporter subunit IIB [Mitsuokella sp. AF33-22]|uniref:PTS galactitol transporter subunit IIB n=1 Tax=Mitsuokella sp. AF33-22 TaxID=2292047 RepID=UPI000E505C2E|nr:PTS galactitol transporter subunit IIB [Mitsuokella sp. AF33-22]RHM54060.1 PTS galactitol transporter subunit IIB [Mitsuokella sp. AF33-22]